MIVTGSRIAVANMTSTSPILTVSSDEMKIGGRMDITDMLNQLPQVNANYLGQDLGNKTSGLSSAGGVSTASLRGLGPSRTLVLVDGRRLGTGSPQTVITSPGARRGPDSGCAGGARGGGHRRRLRGLWLRRHRRRDQLHHPAGTSKDCSWTRSSAATGTTTNKASSGSAWPMPAKPVPGACPGMARRSTASLTAGANILDGRGNVTGYFAYQKMDPVRSSQRDFGSCQLTTTMTWTTCSAWDPPTRTTSVRPTPPATQRRAYSVKGNQFVPRTTAGHTPPAFFNSQGYIYMQRGDERYNAGFITHVDINEFVKPYAEFSFMNDRTHQEVAPTALFRGAQPLTDTSNYKVNCSNPLLSAQQAGLLCTPQQIADDLAEPGLGQRGRGDRPAQRRGRRRAPTTSSTPTTAWSLGMKGRIAEGWTYDTYGQYYYTSFSNINGNDMSASTRSPTPCRYTGTAGAIRVASRAAPACRTTSSPKAA